MSGMLRVYQNFLKRYPLLSQCTQTAILMGTGDIIAQTLVDGKDIKNVSLRRTAEFGGVGFFLVGPSLTTWYGILDKYIGRKGGTVVIKKVALDQLGFAPILIGVLLSTLGVIQTKDVDETIKRVKRDYKDVVLTNYTIWPAVQMANFYFVPLQYQVLLVQCVAIVWNTYLSFKTQGPKLKSSA